MNRIQRIDNWVHNNFWKYQTITKIPLVVMVAVVWWMI